MKGSAGGEYIAAQRSKVEFSKLQRAYTAVERNKRSREKDYHLLFNSMVDGYNTLGLRSPTRLSSNVFWNEYLKTDRQRNNEKRRSATRKVVSSTPLSEAVLGHKGRKKAPAATKLTASSSESEDDADDSDSSESTPKPPRKVLPSSAPVENRPPLQRQLSMMIRSGTAASTSRDSRADYSRDDPEFDDEHRRRLRNNAMSVIETNRPDSAAKSHPFIKKLLTSRIEPPKTIEDDNTTAMLKRKAEREKKRRDQEKRELSRRGLLDEAEEERLEQRKKMLSQEPSMTQAKSAMLLRQEQERQAQVVNPLFLDERTGRELYRVLIQQEIKWTRQAVTESARRNRLAAKKEFAFFS